MSVIITPNQVRRANALRVANRVNFGPLRSLHRFTEAYIDRVRAGVVGSGVSAVGIYGSYAGQNEVDGFVRRAVNILDWSQFVCWLMRSRHNAGTGSTVYSLGGLGVFNGTMVNGPTWGEDGIVFDGADDRIDVMFYPKPENQAFAFGEVSSMVFGGSRTKLNWGTAAGTSRLLATRSIAGQASAVFQGALNQSRTVAQPLNEMHASCFGFRPSPAETFLQTNSGLAQGDASLILPYLSGGADLRFGANLAGTAVLAGTFRGAWHTSYYVNPDHALGVTNLLP